MTSSTWSSNLRVDKRDDFEISKVLIGMICMGLNDVDAARTWSLTRKVTVTANMKGFLLYGDKNLGEC